MEHDGCKLCKYENCSMEGKECMGCKQNAVDKYKRIRRKCNYDKNIEINPTWSMYV